MCRKLLSAAVLVLFPAVALAQQPCTTDARHVIDEIYRHVLERAADPGSSGWVTSLQNGATVRDTVHAIADSPEYVKRFYNAADGALANERAVGNLYRHILGRQPDANGLRTYTSLAAARGVEAVLHDILTSDEYNRTFGDWGVPGSGGLRYCGNTAQAQSRGRRDDSPAQSPGRRDDSPDRRYDSSAPRYGGRSTGPRQFGRDLDMPPNDRFSYLDVNKNGVVDRNEWDGSLDTFYRLDRNNDGVLSRAEMGGARNSSPFAMLDLNGDGRITLGEWPYSHRSFDEMDVDNNGVITRDEFRAGAVPGQGR